MATPMVYGVHFVPPPSRLCPTITWWYGRNCLFCEAKGDSKVEVLVGLGIFVVSALTLLIVLGVLFFGKPSLVVHYTL